MSTGFVSSSTAQIQHQFQQHSILSTSMERSSPLFIQSFLPRNFFPGWTVLLAATIGKCLTSPGQSPCIGVVIDGVVSELGLSRAGLSALYCAATTTSSICLPFAGHAVDFFGMQVSVTVIALCLSFACLVMSWASTCRLLVRAGVAKGRVLLTV